MGRQLGPEIATPVSPSLPRNRNRRACPAVCPAVCPAACPAVRFLFRNTQHEWSGRRFLPLTGELAVTTICCDLFGVLRAIGDEARKCNLSVPMLGLVTSHEIDEWSCRASIFVAHRGIGSPDNLSGLLTEVLTICQDFFCVLRAIFYDAIKCLFTITVSGFVARHKVYKIVNT